MNLLLRVVSLYNTLSRLSMGLRWRCAGIIQRGWRLVFTATLGCASTSTTCVHLLTGYIVVHDYLPRRKLLFHGVARRRSSRVRIILIAMGHYHCCRSGLGLTLARDIARRYGRMSDGSVIIVHWCALIHRERMNRRALSYGSCFFRSLIVWRVHDTRAAGHAWRPSSATRVSWRSHLPEKTLVTCTGHWSAMRNGTAFVARCPYRAQLW